MNTIVNKSEERHLDAHSNSYSAALDAAAKYFPYISLVLVYLWFGGMKFTQYEAEAISGLITNSPLVSFLNPVLGTEGSSILIGIVELTIAGLLALRFVAPRLAAIGAAGSVATFIVTFSFFFSTPGVFLDEVGGLAISVLPGQFLLKDIALLALSVIILNDCVKATEQK